MTWLALQPAWRVVRASTAEPLTLAATCGATLIVRNSSTKSAVSYPLSAPSVIRAGRSARGSMRRLPAGWHVPEKMAAASLAQDRAAAGQQVIASVNPQEWSRSIAAIKLFRANREALDACGVAATKAEKMQRCSVKVEPAVEPEK